MSNLQPNCCLEFDFRKVDQHAGGKWLIHDTNDGWFSDAYVCAARPKWVKRASKGWCYYPLYSDNVRNGYELLRTGACGSDGAN